MAMAEVAAANPSHTSAAGSTVPAVANSTNSKSFTSPSSAIPHTSPQEAQPHSQGHHQHPQVHQQQQQQQQQSQQQQPPPPQQQSQHQNQNQHHQQSSLPAPQYSTSSPPLSGDANPASAFPPHWSQSGQMQFSSPDRNVSRGLPPIMSPMMGISPGGHSNHDLRQPVSPRTVPLGMADPGQDLAALPGDLTAPRKRSKVSRACDECRRKKIRCDATSESGVEQCSSCKRVGSKCSFSRVPMKRGPSKGYIKELADRLNTLENSISTGDLHSYGPGAPGDGENSPGPSDSTSPPPSQLGPAKQGRKRTLSSSSGFHNPLHLQPLTQQPLTPRPNERLPSIDSFHTNHQHPPPSRQLPPPPPQPTPHQPSHQGPAPHSNLPSSASSEPPSSYRTHSSPNGVGLWKGISDNNRRASVSFPFDHTERQNASSKPTGSEQGMFEWDEELVNQYYELIHPTFPLLPESKTNLRARLAEASVSQRNALLEALYSTVRSSPASRSRGVLTSGARRASDLIISSQFEQSNSRSHADNLIYLQTLILMGLEADNHGPGSSGPPKAAWLGAAVGLVYNMRLHSNRFSREKLQAGDPDSDEKLGRRAWWILVVLDRWHAISTSSPLLIPDSSVALLMEDLNVLGIGLYHIARLSCIMGHLAESLTVADGEVSTAYASKLLRGELERFRESVEPQWNQRGALSLVELAYYHVKLLSLRHASRADPVQLLGPALRLTELLVSGQTSATPLSHHFAALALGTLLDLAESEETKNEACIGIQQMMDWLEQRRNTPSREDDGWDKAIKDLIERRRQSRYSTGGGAGGNGGSGGGNGTGGGGGGGGAAASAAAAGGGSDLPRGHGSLQHLAELAVGERSPTTPIAGTNYPTLPHVDMARLQRHGYLGSLVL